MAETETRPPKKSIRFLPVEMRVVEEVAASLGLEPSSLALSRVRQVLLNACKNQAERQQLVDYWKKNLKSQQITVKLTEADWKIADRLREMHGSDLQRILHDAILRSETLAQERHS